MSENTNNNTLGGSNEAPTASDDRTAAAPSAPKTTAASPAQPTVPASASKPAAPGKSAYTPPVVDQAATVSAPALITDVVAAAVAIAFTVLILQDVLPFLN
jgi:hypothetical protein